MNTKNDRFSPALLGKYALFSFALFAPISIALSQISIALAVFGWLGEMFVQRRILWRKTILDWPILIYAVSQLIGAFRAIDVLNGLAGFADTDWFILLYYAVVNLLEDEEDLRRIFVVMLFSGSLSALYGIWQHFYGWDFLRHRMLPYRGNYFRVGGFVAFPLTYGAIQLTILLVALPLVFLWRSAHKRTILAIVVALLLLSLVFSFARSSWMGFGAAALFLVIFWGRKYALFVFAALIVIAVITNIVQPDNIYKKIFLTMFDASPSAPFTNRVRLHLWQTAWNTFSDNWLLGVGLTNYNHYFAMYKVPFDYRGLTAPHSDILHLLAATGILGAVSFMSVWLTALWRQGRVLMQKRIPSDYWQVALLGSFLVVLALIIAGLTQEYYRDAENAELWWFVTALGARSWEKIKQMENTNG
jgi:putative inorganic carbon (HCO3(-)) transporter